MHNAGFPFFASILLVLAAGCGNPGSCVCPVGTHCDAAGQSCLSDVAADLALTGGAADMAMSKCNPPCAGGTFCNANHQCVPCLTDEDCPKGQVCHATGLGTACV